MIEKIYEYRTITLIFGAGLGAILLVGVINYIECSTLSFSLDLNLIKDTLKDTKTFMANFYALIFALPTFFTLWLFRTHDVKEQLEESKKQLIETKESKNTNIFLESIKMLNSENTEKTINLRTAGFLQLMYLRNDKKIFIDRIDKATIRADLGGADLSLADLSGAYLVGADLSEADLTGAGLVGTRLVVAKLIGANLTGANLTGAKLNAADLSGADLSLADLSLADLSGAKYDINTKGIDEQLIQKHNMRDILIIPKK